MSHLFDLACDITRVYAAGMAAATPGAPMVDLTRDPHNIIRRSREVIDEALAENLTLRARVRDLESALTGMVAEHDETENNTEGRYPSADHGCLECTLGTVPDNLNTGLCAYHKAQQLLSASSPKAAQT